MTIELSKAEYQALIICIGYAAGAAQLNGDSVLRDDFLRVANSVGRNYPNYKPYEVGKGKAKP